MTHAHCTLQDPADDVRAGGADDVADDVITAVLGPLHGDSSRRRDDQRELHQRRRLPRPLPEHQQELADLLHQAGAVTVHICARLAWVRVHSKYDEPH